VGGDPARRRELRRLAVVLPLRGGGEGAVPVHKHVIPTHQGRAAEKILFSVIGGPGKVVPNNTHFDTTRANVEYTGAEAVDLVIAEGRTRRACTRSRATSTSRALEALIEERGKAAIPLVIVTITNNSGGGQPVSWNLRACARSAIATACRSSSTLPLRRERVVHPRARAGPAGRGRSRTSSATWRRSPTA
jgi:hypothetical protein